MTLLIIYRIISAIATVLIVVPTYIVLCIVQFIFILCNNLLYVNLIKTEVPKEVLDMFGHNKYVILKFVVAITGAFIHLKESLKSLLTIRF